MVHLPNETAARPDFWNETVAEPNRKTFVRKSGSAKTDLGCSDEQKWVSVDLDIAEEDGTFVVDLDDTQDDGTFGLLQKFEGVVLEHDAEEFTARLIDTSGNLPAHQATFLLDELADAEKALVEQGAPFVWTIGYRITGGTKRRESSFYFRRLPCWSQSEIDGARARVLARQNVAAT